MAEHNIIGTLKVMMREWYAMIMGAKDGPHKYIKYLIIGLCIVLTTAGGFFFYRLYVVYREQTAHKMFNTNMQAYKQALKDTDVEWQSVAEMFEQGHNKNTNSYLAPYFLSFQVEALLKQGKKEEALTVLDTIINKLSNSPLLPLFKMKHALVRIDLEDSAHQQAGVKELESLIREKKNPYRDVALFYLGRYYWATDQVAQAQQVWQQLVDEQRQHKLSPSPWADEVKNILETLVV